MTAQNQSSTTRQSKDFWLNAVAFTVVLIIWSTTPLAVQWSSANAPLTSVSLRMLVGMAFCTTFILLTRKGLEFSKAAWKIYVVGGISIYGGMVFFYLAAQEIPSGWIAVLFGLSPILTGFFASFVEPETRLTVSRGLGLLLGVAGLYLVFSAGLSFADASVVGVLLALGGTVLSSISSVVTRQLVKDYSIAGMQITTGSLIIAIPLFLLTMLVAEPGFNMPFTNKQLMGIVYLGFAGTGIGFTLYFYLLKRISASRLSLVTLITPIAALSLGSWLNNEPLLAEVWIGAGFVCLGLLLYEFKPKLGLRSM